MATLKEKAQAALAAIAPGGGGPHMIEVEESGQHLTCELAAIDSLGCAMNHLSLRTQALASVSGDELKTSARRRRIKHSLRDAPWTIILLTRLS